MSVSRSSLWFWGLLPLALLFGLSIVIANTSVLDFMRRGIPPIEELTFDRVSLAPDLIRLDVVNGGPDPVTVSQVIVDDAFWEFSIEPPGAISRLARARIEVPYPWVQDERHEVTLLTSTGVTITHEIALATATPESDLQFFGIFALIGLYVGLIPVAIGLLWYPLLRRLERRWIHFALALTAGLLIFLAIDALHEALEAAELVAGAFQGVGLVFVAMLGTLLFLQAISRRSISEGGQRGRQSVAILIALGIGLHNLGEGLAIGAAYSLGEAALGAFLIIGFMLHNTTEGLGIVAPIAKDRPQILTLVGLGLLAGAPTIIGAWLGGLAYSALYATIFLAVGVGAIAQVVIALYGVVARESTQGVWSPVTAAGVLAGLLVMYGTGLLVAV